MFLFEYYVARREVASRNRRKSLSGSIVNIVVFSIALCIAVMIIAISILTGFKKEIRSKVIGFNSHIQILKLDSNVSFETHPISSKQPFLNDIVHLSGVKHIQRFGIKAGIMKSGAEFQGVVLKGVGSEYDWTFFKSVLLQGDVIHPTDTGKSKEVIISQYMASRLHLKLNDNFAMYFIQNPPRMRNFKVKGIYETNLLDFDKLCVVCDLKQVVKLNDWKSDEITGFEILIHDFNQIEKVADDVYYKVNYDISKKREPLRVTNAKEKFPQIFDWLNLQDMNITVFLIIMLVVAGFNMISGLLIMILESTSIIGLLKALGTNNSSIRTIFLIESLFLTIKSLLWGNIIGLGLCLFQQYTHLFRLDQSSYYISYVPISINIPNILLLNAGAIVAINLFLIFPSLIIARLDPVKSIQYS